MKRLMFWKKDSSKKDNEGAEGQQKGAPVSVSVDDDVPDEQELEKEGFDPEQIEEEIRDEVLCDFSKDYPGYLELTKEQIQQLVLQYSYVPEDGDIRFHLGHKKGGKICEDPDIVRKLRGVAKEVVKQIGKKILTGSLNLTKVSFPIKAMIPKSALETSIHAVCLFPMFMNRAVLQKDPLERFKLVITAVMSSFFWTNSFLKPLNPILGETLQGYFNDDTEVFGEQISHHPPVSYFLVIGPQNSYRYSGYYNYEAKAGLNSMQILNKGRRSIVFMDNQQKIEFDFPNETYTGVFMGSLKQESLGKMTFTDERYGFKTELTIGKVKGKPSDYFSGSIKNNEGKETSKYVGTYLGYLDFDGVRYWKYENVTPHRIYFKEGPDALESDHHKRSDLITLKQGDLKQAQTEKERMEEDQRRDRKLREEAEKRRNGKKK